MLASVSRPLPSAIVEGIRDLKPLPVTAARLVRALRQTEVSLVEVADIIEHDETVAAEVLRLSSTVLFASRVPPQTVQEAAMRVGIERLLNLVLGRHLQEIRDGAVAPDAAEDRLWLHSNATELAVTALWSENPGLPLPSLVSTAALLHDIGKLVMRRHVDPTYLAQLAARATAGDDRLEAERELFGTDHAEVGAALARSWRFPSDVVEAIANHHAPPERETTPIVDVIMAANLVAKVVGAVESPDRVIPVHLGGSVARLHLPRGAFARVCQQTRQRLTLLCQRASLPVPPADPQLPSG